MTHSPDPLAPLLAPLTALRGVGSERAALLAKLAGGDRVLDLLFHLPETCIDRRERPTIRGAQLGQIATFEVEVVRHERPASSRQPARVIVSDGTGYAELAFFPGGRRWLPGQKVLVSGKVETFNGRVSIAHPDHIVPADKPERLPQIEPVWSLTGGLFRSQLASAMAQAVARLPQLPEWHDPALLRREGWPPFAEALRQIQTPREPAAPKAKIRLAYDELLAGQLALALMRGRIRQRPGRALVGDGRLRRQALDKFGFPLTPSQAIAGAEISLDMASPTRMLRLLQGDVGSGKTLVALLAMLTAAEAGSQAALMAPTELLANQHYRVLWALSPEPVVLLTGSVGGTARSRALRSLASGDAKLAVGTHALFQDAVAYRDLGLAVIDEQHRFGVEQRLTLGDKGTLTDVLVMTATPIPRTLLLTQWGAMAVSRLTEKPGNPPPIRTTLHSLATLPDVLDAIGRKLDEGAHVYWVCPLVAESEATDLKAAEERFAELRERFGALVGLAHGQQDSARREAMLTDFAAGRIRLLVATTVVEVGMDVPDASVMVVEHAERFGLAQLHQLRGRVGRGTTASFCLLLHADGLTEIARRRLTLLRQTQDGFRIADEDFRLRGHGDVLGKKQAGPPGWRLADPIEHEDWLLTAERDARALLSRDPDLASARGEACRTLLRLFDRAGGLDVLSAG